jgi:hypothetical protein
MPLDKWRMDAWTGKSGARMVWKIGDGKSGADGTVLSFVRKNGEKTGTA